MNAKDEMVVIVDEHNNAVAVKPRREMRLKNLIHRAGYVLVFNSRGQIFVQKRTPIKDVYPGYFDVAAGGVVSAGESYRMNAERELGEELGIFNVSLHELFDFYHQNTNIRVWGRAYRCVYDGPMVLQEEEVESGAFYDVPDILNPSSPMDVTPDGLYVLKRHMKER